MKRTDSNPGTLRYIVVIIIVNVLICAFTLIWSIRTTKSKEVVYVDAIKLLNGYMGMKEARKEYELKVSGWNANLDTLKSEMETKFQEYDANRLKLSLKERSLMEELLETKRQQYLDYQKIISEKASKEDQDLTARVYTKVNDYIKKYAQDKGYRFVLSANQYGSIVYAKDAADITEEVLEGLNAAYAK